MTTYDRLFSGKGVHELRHELLRSVDDAVSRLSKASLCGEAVERLVDEVVGGVLPDVPRLDLNNANIDREEIRIDISHVRSRVFDSDIGPVHVDGFRYTLHVPFFGSPELFFVQPTSHALRRFHVTVRGDELLISFEAEHSESDSLSAKINGELKAVETELEALRADTKSLGQELQRHARSRISARIKRLDESDAAVASLGYPLRRRNNVPSTHSTPLRRRAIPIREARDTSASTTDRDPYLANEPYEDVLQVLRNMVDVMERSPRAFRGLNEEDIRFHFLLFLNALYEGRASGETFNYQGKTDIHLRDGGRSVFVAECKFWSGPKEFGKALSQLLGYLTWRDTKAALLIFNRDSQMSTILEKVPFVVKSHSGFIDMLDSQDETEFRFRVAHLDDKRRALTVTAMVFDVPRAAPGA